MPRKKPLLYGIIMTGIVLSSIFLLMSFQEQLQNKQLPVLGAVPDFILYDSSGKEFSLDSLKGKIWVADFIFTTCGNICPIMTKNMAALHRSFLLLDNVRMVSISVNPETDSPEILARFAQKYGADTAKWHFLTGRREAIQRLAVYGFKIGSIKEPIFHSDRFVLVDAKAHIRGYYEGTSQEGRDVLFKDIALLLKEKQNGRP